MPDRCFCPAESTTILLPFGAGTNRNRPACLVQLIRDPPSALRFAADAVGTVKELLHEARLVGGVCTLKLLPQPVQAIDGNMSGEWKVRIRGRDRRELLPFLFPGRLVPFGKVSAVVELAASHDLRPEVDQIGADIQLLSRRKRGPGL